MSKDYLVNKNTSMVMAFFAVVFLLAAVSLFLVGSWIGGGICLVLMLLYVAVAAMYGATVHIDSTGVSRKVLFLPKESYTWEELKEVGVFGSKVFNKSNPKKVGTLYMYFSTEEMSDVGRFNMVLRWPPKQIHFVFSQRSLEIVQYFWDKKIASFNVGDLRV